MDFSPVCLFVYNRPDHTLQTLSALSANEGTSCTDLFVFSDAEKPGVPFDAEMVQATRQIIRRDWPFRRKYIIQRKKNTGLSGSIISGVDEVIEQHGKVIVLEDDLITSSHFLRYMNSALRVYEAAPKVSAVSGYRFPHKPIPEYSYDTYLFPRNSTWGWGTWHDRWSKVSWNNDFMEKQKRGKTRKLLRRGGLDLPRMVEKQLSRKIDSWGIRWCYKQIVEGTYTVFPCVSYVQNRGFDGSGTNCHTKRTYATARIEAKEVKSNFCPGDLIDEKVIKHVAKCFTPSPQEAIRIIGSRLRAATKL